MSFLAAWDEDADAEKDGIQLITFSLRDDLGELISSWNIEDSFPMTMTLRLYKDNDSDRNPDLPELEMSRYHNFM